MARRVLYQLEFLKKKLSIHTKQNYFFFTPEKSCKNDILENNHKDTLQMLRQLFLMSKEICLGPSQSFLYFPLPQSYLFETHDRHRRKLQILKHIF